MVAIKAGSKIKLQSIENKSVIEINKPKACVPLKVEAVKIKNPVNKRIATQNRYNI